MSRTGVEDLVTICTVVTPLHKRLATIGYRLARALNPEVAPRWIICEVPELSFPPSRIATLFMRTHRVGRHVAVSWQADYLEVLKARHFELDAMGELTPDATVLPGPGVDDTIGRLAARWALSPAAAEERLSDNIGSYQHAAGLRAALAQVRTRFVVVIDPDLYVVRPGWIADILAHMQARRLSVFGVPWHPRWYQKQRRFPAPHLMVVDLNRTGPIAELMEPDLRAPGDRFVSETWRQYVKAQRVDSRAAGRILLKRLGTALSEDLRQRRSIGRARDTGYAVAAAVAARGGRVETAVPVFRRGTGFVPESVSALQTGLLPEALLPGSWRYRPRGGVSTSGFREAGYPDVGARQWEEFIWAGAPFAFHLRSDPRRKETWRVDHEGLLFDLNAILARHGRPALDPPSARVQGVPDGGRARLLARMLDGEPADEEAAALLVRDHAYPELRKALRRAAIDAAHGGLGAAGA